MTPILILAAGAASRMRGADKLLEQVDGLPLLRQRALAAIGTGQDIFVTLPDLAHPRAAVLRDLNVTQVAVPNAATGMAASLRTGVAALPDCSHFMVLLADLPEITTQDMTLLLQQSDQTHRIWRGTAADGTPGHPILFASSLRPLFANLTGDHGGKNILATNPTRLVPLPGYHATRDLDTPEDWAAWRRETGR